MKYFKLYVGYLLVKKLRIVLFNLKNHHHRNSQSCVCSIGCSANWEGLWEGRFLSNLLTEGGNWTSNKVKNKEKLCTGYLLVKKLRAYYYYYSSNLRAYGVCDYDTLPVMWQDLTSYLTTYIYKYIRPYRMIFFCPVTVKLSNCLLRSRDSEYWT